MNAVDAFTKPAPPPASSGHSRSAPRAHSHTGRTAHGRSQQAPAGETRNRPGRGPENDVKVDADDGGGPTDTQGASEANAPEHGATGHGAPQARSPRKHSSRPSHNNPVSRPGTGADSGFADADDSALPPEAAAAVKEADELQRTAQQAAGPRASAPDNTQNNTQNNTPNTAANNAQNNAQNNASDNTSDNAPDNAQNNNAPQGAAPAGAPGAASAAPKGTGRGRPANQMTDKSTNQTGSRKAGRAKTPRSMPVAFFSGPVTQGSHLVLHMSAGTSPQHTVTLQCDPAGGTHPKAVEACADVAKAGGDLAQMPANTSPRACFMIYAPVTVTAQGEWKGQPVRYTKKFPNTCVMRDKTGSVFDF